MIGFISNEWRVCFTRQLITPYSTRTDGCSAYSKINKTIAQVLTEWFIGFCSSVGAGTAATYHEIAYAIAGIERLLIDVCVIFSMQLLLLVLQNKSIALLEMIGKRQSLLFIGR